MSSSLPQTATNSQSLNGIITLSDGVITIEDGVISGLTELDLIDLQVSDTATIENLVVNNQIDMTLGQIKNVAAPTDNGDATNKQYVDTNFLNKTTTTNQIVASKVMFNNSTTDVNNPVITMFNITGGSENGNFLRFQKGVVETTNTQIGGLSACDKTSGNTLIRVADLIFSRGSSGEARMDLKVINGSRNPLTITDGVFISRNNRQYFQKQDGTNLFNYLDYLDYVAFAKDISLGSNKIINLAEPTLSTDASTKNYTDTQSANTNYLKRDGSLAMTGGLNMNSKLISNLSDPVSAQDASTKYYTDNHSNNGNYLLRNGTLPMTGNLQMGSYKITNLLDPFDLNDGANKYYVDTQSANTHYLLRNGSLSMTGNLNLATHNLITTGDINCNDITADGNINTTADMSCADFNSAGNQVIGGSSSNVLDVKSSAFFEANVLIETNKHLAFNSGTLSSTNGMLMNYDGGVGFLDIRGSEFRIRTSSSTTPSDIRFKVNDTNTTVKNNFFVDGSTTLGDTPSTDQLTIKAQTNFPDESKLTFNLGADCEYQSGADLTFKNGSNVLYEIGANLTFNNIHTFNVQSYINGARINLIRKTSDFKLGLSNVENGVISDPGSSGLIITMPNTGGGTGLYWNRRHYIIKLQDGGQTKLRQNSETTPTRIDEKTGDIDYNTAWKTIQLVFDENYSGNGKIHIISDR